MNAGTGRGIAAAVVAAALLAPPAVTHASGGTLTITGTRSASTVLVVKKTVRYNLVGATAEWSGGDFGGFVIGDDAPSLWSAHVLRDQRAFSGMSDTNYVLRPGRYKVRLFTDGQPVTVRVPWTGSDVTLRPDTPIDARVQVEQKPLPGADSTVGASIPQDGRTRANTTAMVRVDALVGPSVRVRLCLTRRADTCSDYLLLVTQPAGGTVLNAHGAGFHDPRRREPTKGLYVRGEVTGTVVGLLTVVTLRYYR